MTIGTLVMIAVLAVIALILIFSTFFTVQQQSAAIVERFGKYHKTAHSGLNVKMPFIDRIAHRVSLRVQQLPVEVETKTKDNVFVKIAVAVQYRVVNGSEADSYYKLEDHEEQITSYVLDVVRAKVPKMDLDEVFEKKDEVGEAVKAELAQSINSYGFEIPNALVTDVDPAESVKEAMNAIQTQTRLQVAAQAKGEANKILAVKNAEADKETKRLAGEGIAAEREAIAEGIKKSVETIKAAGDSVSAGEAMHTLMLAQYFDTMRDIGKNSNASTVFLPYSPGGMSNMMEQIAQAIMVGNQAPEHKKPADLKAA
jgi:regulator of protease activity HflC (stomatin/prohibitin superfamily)